MALVDLVDWMDEFTGPGFIWYVKRLSGNDTLANGSHQAGPYIPKEFLFSIFPELKRVELKNPDVWFDLCVDSHPDKRKVRAIWYNNKFHGKAINGRNEARLTNLGGSVSALLDPESTGALTVFVFLTDEKGIAESCHVWVCRHGTEEDLVEDRIGPVEPGRWKIWTPDEALHGGLFEPVERPRPACWLEHENIPPAWLACFPTGAEIIEKTVKLRPEYGLDPDTRLIRRRDCEFEIFRSVEEAIELPWIKKGFGSVDEFIARAQTVLQRRKVRSGRSLELHACAIFREEGLVEGTDFSHQPVSEPGKRPDFLFPSEKLYKDSGFPDKRLRMLAVKTTCKDRWRQILNEADRIREKHLLTLQEGVSEGQFREMTESDVRLVVPARLIDSYPKAVRPHLQTLESFIGDVRLLRL